MSTVRVPDRVRVVRDHDRHVSSHPPAHRRSQTGGYESPTAKRLFHHPQTVTSYTVSYGKAIQGVGLAPVQGGHCPTGLT